MPMALSVGDRAAWEEISNYHKNKVKNTKRIKVFCVVTHNILTIKRPCEVILELESKKIRLEEEFFSVSWPRPVVIP